MGFQTAFFGMWILKKIPKYPLQLKLTNTLPNFLLPLFIQVYTDQTRFSGKLQRGNLKIEVCPLKFRMKGIHVYTSF